MSTLLTGTVFSEMMFQSVVVFLVFLLSLFVYYCCISFIKSFFKKYKLILLSRQNCLHLVSSGFFPLSLSTRVLTSDLLKAALGHFVPIDDNFFFLNLHTFLKMNIERIFNKMCNWKYLALTTVVYVLDVEIMTYLACWPFIKYHRTHSPGALTHYINLTHTHTAADPNAHSSCFRHSRNSPFFPFKRPPPFSTFPYNINAEKCAAYHSNVTQESEKAIFQVLSRETQPSRYATSNINVRKRPKPL